jgi:hypothetical protein
MQMRVGIPDTESPDRGLGPGELFTAEQSGCGARNERIEDHPASEHESLLLLYSNSIGDRSYGVAGRRPAIAAP